MSLPTKPYTFTNGTTADGGQVDDTFDALFAALSAGGLDPTVFAASALGSREVGLDVVGVDVAASNQTLNGTLTDVTGATFNVTPVVASKLLIASRVGLTAIAVSGNEGLAGTSIVLDGTATIGGSIVGAAWPAGSTTVAASIAFGVLSLSAAAHTIKLQANVTGSGSGQVTGRSQMWGLLVAA